MNRAMLRAAIREAAADTVWQEVSTADERSVAVGRKRTRGSGLSEFPDNWMIHQSKGFTTEDEREPPRATEVILRPWRSFVFRMLTGAGEFGSLDKSLRRARGLAVSSAAIRGKNCGRPTVRA
jgi:hypothetical protein